ncbi:hypothetical protein BC343_12585 [Mucilaginibacter pedocola]|uniref:Zinc-finger domain-containing protein n=2 Tax=Mucilaginibacter pedocola TaxID=1792845 RepID=A0A1S9PAA1_9SPHI|nr:hypothetical protein BC343_12585 [Mucilaginibacter pedocola]
MNPLKGIIYNCRKATFLADKKLEGKISFVENIQLRIHLVGCDACKLYLKQSGKLTAMVKDLMKTPVGSNVRLDSDFKEQLQERIDTHLSKN